MRSLPVSSGKPHGEGIAKEVERCHGGQLKTWADWATRPFVRSMKICSVRLQGVFGLAAAMLLVFPRPAHSQSTIYNFVSTGVVTEVDGTGSILPGFPMGAPTTYSITWNSADLKVADASSYYTKFSDPSASVILTGDDGPCQLTGAEFIVYACSGAEDVLSILTPPNINTGAGNGLVFTFPQGTVTTRTWNDVLTLLRDAPSSAEPPNDNSFFAGYDASGMNGVSGTVLFPGHSFSTAQAAEPPVAALAALGGIGLVLLQIMSPSQLREQGLLCTCAIRRSRDFFRPFWRCYNSPAPWRFPAPRPRTSCITRGGSRYAKVAKSRW